MADRGRQQLGNYHLIRMLGRGTFADVYLAQHVHLQTQAAVKILHERLAKADVDRFLTEARTIAHLRHPHIVRVLDFGVQDGTPFLVLDYAPHGNLRQLYPKGTQVPLATVVSYVKQVAGALQYAHQQQLIHRDIKPENMLLGYNDEILLSDFGIAILAQNASSQLDQDTAGTIAYMAPEQFQAHPCPASDQYALGIVVYEWLCGERPFDGSFPEIAIKHTLTAPPSLREKVATIPLAAEQVILKSLVKDPQRRFASIEAFAVALEEASKAESSGQTLLPHTFPMGTVTLLFADIAASTQLLQQLGNRYADILTTCRHLLRAAFQQWNGHEVDTQEETFLVAFARATDAVSAAVTAQRSFHTHSWPENVKVRVRMALHTGEPTQSPEGYIGLDVHYAARFLHAAHGGQVLLSHTTQELVAHDLPEGVSSRDLGLYHLKNIHGSKRLFQLIIIDLPADFPPLKTLDVRLNNLSVQLTPLIGREQEVRVVTALLQRPDVRLVTLTGMGGIGKTRLGLQVATELLDSFASGTYFVSLASITDPLDVIDTIAHLFGLEHQHVRQRLSTEHMEYLKAFLHDKHLLLLLDNFEQVIAAAPDLTELLAACPQLKILVTSRVVLHIQGEHEFSVPPLALPKRTLLSENEDFSQYAAVALFLERALAVKPDLTITKANIQAIAAICVHLDGLPLAIELAAARSKLFPPRALLQRMTHRLDILTGGVQGVPMRQQTLRNTIAWSYNLLDATEQQLFQRLSVFVGSYALEAVEALYAAFPGGAAQVLDGVASLIDKSLLLQIEQEGEEPRLVMLEILREYGLEVLAASGEEEIIRQAHVKYYLSLAEEAEKEVGGTQQAVWLERLEREHENLRAALHWLVKQTGVENLEKVLRLAGALWWFWSVRGHISEGRSFLEKALAKSENAGTAVRAKALVGAGMLALNQDDYDLAETMCRESLALFRELGDKRGMAASLYKLGLAAWWKNNYTTARSSQEEALALYREMGDKGGAADPLLTLSNLAFDQGDYAEARSLAEESLMLFREVGDTWGTAYVLLNLARVIFFQGDVAKAQTLIEECLALSRELDYKAGIADALALLGQFVLYQGDAATAHSLEEESLLLFRTVGDRRGTGRTLFLLAKVLTAQGDAIAAQTLYEKSLAMSREVDDKENVASCLEGMAEVAVTQGTASWAAQLWGAAEVLRESVGLPIPLIDHADYEQAITVARSQLGEKVFTTEWTQGRTMTLEQVLASQGQEVVSLPTRTATILQPIYPAGLTAREVEVLRLVAKGQTNAEIAEELGLSGKTISHHLTHIFNKTSSENRASAAAFAIRHGLA